MTPEQASTWWIGIRSPLCTLYNTIYIHSPMPHYVWTLLEAGRPIDPVPSLSNKHNLMLHNYVNWPEVTTWRSVGDRICVCPASCVGGTVGNLQHRTHNQRYLFSCLAQIIHVHVHPSSPHGNLTGCWEFSLCYRLLWASCKKTLWNHGVEYRLYMMEVMMLYPRLSLSLSLCLSLPRFSLFYQYPFFCLSDSPSFLSSTPHFLCLSKCLSSSL